MKVIQCAHDAEFNPGDIVHVTLSNGKQLTGEVVLVRDFLVREPGYLRTLIKVSEQVQNYYSFPLSTANVHTFTHSNWTLRHNLTKQNTGHGLWLHPEFKILLISDSETENIIQNINKELNG